MPAVVLAGALISSCAPAHCSSQAANEIVAENCKPGSPASEWDVAGAGDPSIQGFAAEMSVAQGATVQFKVKTEATNYRLDIYRMGFYAGAGARKVATVEPTAALPQAQPDCLRDDATGLIDCATWGVSASWAVPADAVSGIYFAKLVREDVAGAASHVVFVVRDDDGASDLLVQTSDTTWQAYNSYGGTSLYTGGPGQSPARAYRVSYNRPFNTRAVAREDWVFNAEYPMVRFLERNGYDVSYVTGADGDRLGAELLEHRAFVSSGHDEYWSGAQRANVEAARDAGVDLAFFSGNEVFWKTRWEDAHRTLVSYKETHAGAKIDPTTTWTGTWRDGRSFNPEGARPENALTGTLFTVNSGTTAIRVPADDGKLRLWRGTAVATQQPGQTATLAPDTLGYEWDEDVDNGARPAGLIRQSSTTVDGVEKLQDNGSTYAPGTATHRLTLHRDANGAGPDALVFGAGTVQWAWGLDDKHDRGSAPADARMQQATVNLLADMGAQPGSRQSGLAAATASTDATAPSATITSPAAGATVERGSAVSIEGTASDGGGGVVGGVEVSTDDGQTWHPATGRESWRYTWTPAQDGPATLRARAADDSANLGAPSAGTAVVVGPPAPAVCPCSIFEAETPGQASANDGQAVEVGVRFRSDDDGFITGLRFYKGPQNTGTHVGHLWTNGGQQLAEATFTGETATGWQQVTLDSPVAVTKDTTYVASYHTTTGFYAFDANFFATGKHNPPLHGLASGVDGANGVFKYGASGFPTDTFGASNYWVDVVFERFAAPDTRAPQISAIAPADGAPDVAPGVTVSARFDEPMDPATIDATTFALRQGSTAVAADVAYDAGTRTATLTPRSALARATTYTATVQGGLVGPAVKDRAGNPLAEDRTWSFTTAAPPPPPPDEGPGGPILVISAAGDPFGRYYGEILRSEGLNAFTVKDLSTVSAATLAGHGVAILAQTGLSAAQATMLDTWVQGGGNLIAMRPDPALAGLLGVAPAGPPIADAYLRVDTSGAPGAGITGETMQYHGAASRFTLAGASAVATLHADAATATPHPAVTLRAVGGSGGQAAAFAYDLARSVVFTRQGNPAWAGQERDGQQGPIRSDDLFFPDWIDFAKVAIPQADEQQRLLANLVTHMHLDRAPLPRFWYLPRGEKAGVVLTGDDHASGGTSGQFDRLRAASPAGCSVEDWECLRSTSYVYPGSPLTDAQAAGYQADGFEVALHPTTDCQNFTPASLDAVFDQQLLRFAAAYPSVAPPRTNRTHCIAWSDWATHPKVELDHGIRLDANYYYWPASWIQDRPGMFTGSGFPQRFADADGSLIDVYQATTQLTDESGQTIPTHIAALLDRALGPQGYHGVFTANMHTDQADHAGANAIVAAATARGVPVVSARQMLAWLDGRNASSFGGVSFAGGELRFSVAAGAGARGLEAMVPAQSASGTLTSLTRGGQPVVSTLRSVKGVAYAAFPAAAGAYVATYQGDTDAPAISAVAATARADGTATVTWQTDEPATSQVRYGTSAGALTGDVSQTPRVTSHSVGLSGLQPGTTYHYRVTSADASGNAASSPAPPATATFDVPATPEQSLVDTTVADFAAGTPGTGTYVGATGSGADGEVVLRPAVGEELGGSLLPAGWSATPWGAGGAATVAGGTLTVDGARAGTDALFGPGRTLDFTGAFTATEFQHLGLGVDYNDNPAWAMFSTGGGALPVGLYARTNGPSATNTAIPGVTATEPHRYRIAWTASQVEFFVDGTSVATHPTAITADLRPLGSDFPVGGGAATWHWVRLSPYAAGGTFASRVLDSGAAGSDWTALEPLLAAPAGTQVTIRTRTGDSPTPGPGWSPFEPLGGLGSIQSPPGRYLQYEAALASDADTRTPALERVTVGFRP